MSKPVYKSITEEIRNSMNIIREDPGLNFSPATYNNLIDNNQLTNETLADGLYRELYDFRNSVIYFTKHCIDETNPSFKLKKYCLTKSQSLILRKLFEDLIIEIMISLEYMNRKYDISDVNLSDKSTNIENDFHNFMLMHTYLINLYDKLKKTSINDADLMTYLKKIYNKIHEVNKIINQII